MAEADSEAEVRAGRIAGLDTSVAHPARVYDYWLGGKDNFAADREAAEQVLAGHPGIRVGVRANRAFLGRAVRYLAAEAGIRQFLDIGTGHPHRRTTRTRSPSAAAPDCRVVYVDNDPIVLAHARALLTEHAGGRDRLHRRRPARPGHDPGPGRGTTLDFGQPVAVMLLGVLHLIPDARRPVRHRGPAAGRGARPAATW